MGILAPALSREQSKYGQRDETNTSFEAFHGITSAMCDQAARP